jgi:hypothetical protein
MMSTRAPAPEGAGDFHELLLGHGEVAHLAVRRESGAEPGEEGGRARATGGPVDPAPGRAGLEAEAEVLRDGEVGKQGRLLVDAGDAERVGGGGLKVGERAAGEREGAGVGLVGAGDDLDERALASAVLAEQGVNLAGLQIEIDAPEGPRAAERLGDLAEFEQRSGHGARRSERDGRSARRGPVEKGVG